MATNNIEILLASLLTPKALKIAQGKIVIGISAEDWQSWHQWNEWSDLFKRIDTHYTKIMADRSRVYGNL